MDYEYIRKIPGIMPREVEEIINLMEAGKIREAEKILDYVLGQVGSGEAAWKEKRALTGHPVRA